MQHIVKKIIIHFRTFMICFVLIGLNCASLKNIVNVKKPVLSFYKVQITGISFNDVNLRFDVKVENPNPMSATLHGFDYEFLIDGKLFLSGIQEDIIKIEATNSSIVSIPLTLIFKDIYTVFSSLKAQDSVLYQARFGFNFNLPILGETRIPLSKDGYLPLLKLPNLHVNKIKLQSINISSADLAVQLKLTNPNNYNFNLNRINYDLSVNDNQWIKGATSQAVQLRSRDSNILTIPISLNFFQMGHTVYNLVRGDEFLNYELNSSLDIGSENILFQRINIPLTTSGTIKISK